MIAIVDSGSTKTDWCFINSGGGKIYLKTIGLSPYFVSREDVLNCLEKEICPFIDNKKVEKVFFYGTGCANDYKKVVLLSPLEDFFSYAEVRVESDLLGASIALHGNNAGITSIIGTGSSTCYYDGCKISLLQPSLGYVLGDEGSGAHIGTVLLRAFLNDEMPKDISKKFSETYPYTLTEILDKTYNASFPNRFLATFAIFAASYIDDTYIRKLIKPIYGQFFDKQLLKLEQVNTHKIRMIGSLASHLESLIEEVAKEKNLKIDRIESSPMRGLIEYHIGTIIK